MAVRLALRIRGLPAINYEVLKLVATHFLGIPSVGVKRIAETLAEVESSFEEFRIARGKREVIITKHGKLLVAVERFAPWINRVVGRRLARANHGR